jgi:hypothetical protein
MQIAEDSIARHFADVLNNRSCHIARQNLITATWHDHQASRCQTARDDEDAGLRIVKCVDRIRAGQKPEISTVEDYRKYVFSSIGKARLTAAARDASIVKAPRGAKVRFDAFDEATAAEFAEKNATDQTYSDATDDLLSRVHSGQCVLRDAVDLLVSRLVLTVKRGSDRAYTSQEVVGLLDHLYINGERVRLSRRGVGASMRTFERRKQEVIAKLRDYMDANPESPETS